MKLDATQSGTVVSFTEYKRHKDEITHLQNSEVIDFTMKISGDVDNLDQLDCLIAQIASLGISIDVVMISGDEVVEEVIVANDS